MSNILRPICLFLLFCRLLYALGIVVIHEHDWIDATCTEPRICSVCGAEEGSPLGHDFQGGTCISLPTCIRCGISGGDYAPHNWTDATCTEPEQCSVCGKDRHWYSMPLGHEWEDATCTTPKTCSRCGATDGEPQHYFYFVWHTVVDSTCQETGVEERSCLLCGYTESQVIPLKQHEAGYWQEIVKATPSTDGVWKRYCVMCGLEMGTEQRKYVSSSNSKDLTGNTSSNGNNFNSYNNESQQNTSANYVVNKSSRVFHLPSCRDVPKIAPQNYSTSNESRETLISLGYKSCGHCNS